MTKRKKDDESCVDLVAFLLHPDFCSIALFFQEALCLVSKIMPIASSLFVRMTYIER